jgi:hypothetical protein
MEMPQVAASYPAASDVVAGVILLASCHYYWSGQHGNKREGNQDIIHFKSPIRSG